MEDTIDNVKVASQRNHVNYPPTHYQLPTRNRFHVLQEDLHNEADPIQIENYDNDDGESNSSTD